MPYDEVKPTAELQQALKDELSGAPWFRSGAVVAAKLLRKETRAAFFEVGNFGTGIVYGAELQASRQTLKDMQPGNEIPAKIVSVEGHQGYMELSLSEAGEQQAWQEVRSLEESGEAVPVKITGANQGGLLADLKGLKAFIPVSQLAGEHSPKDTSGDREKLVEELKGLVGEELTVKVISTNPRVRKLILSERDAMMQSENVKELLAQYEVGQTVQGIVSGIADFGVFVKFADNPEVEGLVHISEIDHRIIDSPKEIVAMGESVEVKIIDIKEGRVFLSLKALKPDPWLHAHELFKEGQEVEGHVYKFNPFGAVVDLNGGVQGLIHVSEFGGLDEMKAILEPKKSYTFIIAAVKPDEKRIILKAKK